MKRQTVYACVVTFNRPKLLKQNLDALVKQSAFLKDKIKMNILVWDNSDRETSRWQNKDIIRDIVNCGIRNITIKTFLNDSQNTDASLGFNKLVEYAAEDGEQEDLIWIMDDDTIPEENALHELLKAFNEEQTSFVNSFVMFRNTNEPFYKNIPRDATTNEELFDKKNTEDFETNFGTFTSFLTSVKNVFLSGLPQKEFRIWGDDTEFSERLIKSTGHLGKLATKSIVKHMTKQNDKTVWELYPINETRMKNFYYGYRNRIIASRRRGGMKSMFGTIKRELSTIKQAFRSIKNDDSLTDKEKNEKRNEIKDTALAGCFAGIFTSFKIEYPNNSSKLIHTDTYKR